MTKSHLNWNKYTKRSKYYPDNVTPFIHYEDNLKTIFYPNGKIAVNVEKFVIKNYEVYTVFKQKENNKIGINQEHKEMVAAFDSDGNGIVLNEDDRIKLTFNQIGGICFDKCVARAPFAWTWSRYNKEPIVKAIYFEPATTHLEKVLRKNVKSPLKSSVDKNTRKSVKISRKKSSTEKVLMCSPSINYNTKVKNEILPPIKTICIKINNYISFRIVDRRNINLQFFAGTRSIRIDLGFDVNFHKPLKSFLDDLSWGPKAFLRCRFEDDFITNWINSKTQIFESFQEDKEDGKIVKSHYMKSYRNEKY